MVSKHGQPLAVLIPYEPDFAVMQARLLHNISNFITCHLPPNTNYTDAEYKDCLNALSDVIKQKPTNSILYIG